MECYEICEPCVWGKPISPLVEYLYHFLEMQDGKCPIERHELLDEHWRYLGYMENVRAKYWQDRAAQEAAERKAQEA